MHAGNCVPNICEQQLFWPKCQSGLRKTEKCVYISLAFTATNSWNSKRKDSCKRIRKQNLHQIKLLFYLFNFRTEKSFSHFIWFVSTVSPLYTCIFVSVSIFLKDNWQKLRGTWWNRFFVHVHVHTKSQAILLRKRLFFQNLIWVKNERQWNYFSESPFFLHFFDP